jgi:hypothetical protein
MIHRRPPFDNDRGDGIAPELPSETILGQGVNSET